MDLTPAQRRKALAGRVLEAAGGAKLGKGEASVREAERNKASKRVRLGLVEKKKAREMQHLEEVSTDHPHSRLSLLNVNLQAKHLGNYHPTIKKLFDSSKAENSKRRERGLKIGVGKFSGGMLKLTKSDIDVVQGLGQTRGGPRSHRGRGRFRVIT